MKKDSSVELLRVIGCFIVIGVHIPFSPIIDNTYDFSRTFIQCVLGDGVAIFWAITGCFLFKSLYGKVLKRTFKSIVVPIVLFNVFFFFLGDFLYNDFSLLQSIQRPLEAYSYLAKSFLSWSNSTEFVHLWYMYVYAFLMLLYPCIKAFVSYLDESNKRIKTYMAISFLLLVLNDVTQNQLFNFSHSLIGAFFPAANLFVFGHILYEHIAIFCSKKWMFIGLTTFGVVNIVRAILQYRLYLQGDQMCHMLLWYTSFGLVCAVALFVFATSFMTLVNHERFSKFVNFFASYTFSVYIVHLPVVKLLVNYQVVSLITDKVYSLGSNYAVDFLYLIIVITVVFVLSLIISVTSRYTIRAGKKVVSKLKNIKVLKA